MATSNDEHRDGDKPTLMERITAMLLREPEDREELTDIQYGRRDDVHGWMTRLDA